MIACPDCGATFPETAMYWHHAGLFHDKGPGVLASFRSEYAAEVPMRIVDLVFHVALATLLPGPWWAQFLPDALTVCLFLHGYISDRFLPQNDPLLRLHRLMHLRGEAGVLALFLLLTAGRSWPAFLPFMVHWLTHAAVDAATHKERWQ